MPTNCNRCGEQISWPDPYQQGQKPLNADGTAVHNCKGESVKQAPQSASETLTSEQIIKECETFHIAFKERNDTQYDALARIYISRMMSNRK